MKRGKIRKESGKITFGRARFLEHVASIPDNVDYIYELDELGQKRTKLQNAFMHLCFDVYSDERGMSLKHAKWKLKKEYGINELVKDPDTGRQDLLVRNTSDYNLDEGKLFINRILKHMEFDCGIIIDSELKKQFRIETETGELKEIK